MQFYLLGKNWSRESQKCTGIQIFDIIDTVQSLFGDILCPRTNESYFYYSYFYYN